MVRIDIKVKKYGIEIRKEIQWNGSKVYFPAFFGVFIFRSSR
jgi:hypothetical protein